MPHALVNGVGRKCKYTALNYLTRPSDAVDAIAEIEEKPYDTKTEIFDMSANKMSLGYLLSNSNGDGIAYFSTPSPLPSLCNSRDAAVLYADQEFQLPGSPVSQKNSRDSTSVIREGFKRLADQASTSTPFRKMRAISRHTFHVSTSNDFSSDPLGLDVPTRLPTIVLENRLIHGDSTCFTRGSRWTSPLTSHERELGGENPNQPNPLRRGDGISHVQAQTQRDNIQTRSSLQVPPLSNAPMHVCFCGRAFNKREHLKRHNMLVHQEVRPFKCNACELRFGTKQNMQVHLSTRKHRQRLAGKKSRPIGLANQVEGS
jgi:hypothetical protein